jgi:hypothetical protein
MPSSRTATPCPPASRATRPDGIPFAYPPLAFYPLAGLLDLGVPALSLARFLPGLLTILALLPTYLLGRELLGSDSRAGFAALVVATSPAVLTWHLSAGDVARSLAFFLTVCGLYTGYRLFDARGDIGDASDSGDTGVGGDANDDRGTAADAPRRWAILTATLFGLVVLTHPLYPVLFGSGVAYFYLVCDRSPRGLLVGVAVALGGVVLAAPWWLTTISRHGFGIFTRTAGSRLGIGQGLVWFPTNFAYLPETRFLALWHVLVLLGVLALLARRRYLLVGWFATMALVYPEPRFLLFVGAFPASAFVFDVLVPALVGRIVDERDRSAARTRTDAGSAGTGGSQPATGRYDIDRDRLVVLAVLCVLALYGTGTAALYAANYEPIPDRPLDRLLADPLPAHVDRADLQAMAWTRRNTPPEAAFVVAGDAAEWFPFLAERTSLASPWGARMAPTAGTRNPDRTVPRGRRVLHRSVSLPSARPRCRPGDERPIGPDVSVRPAGGLAQLDRPRRVFENPVARTGERIRALRPPRGRLSEP